MGVCLGACFGISRQPFFSHIIVHFACDGQRLIFDEPEDGVRKIVLATNIAETSITINDVVFVIDCGKAKETSYDALNNTPCLLPSWISKVSAKQKRKRAGRVQPESVSNFIADVLKLASIYEFLSRAFAITKLLA
ncbi:hypothetical protein LOK49_Contig81G00001, partial [Camellia lanceoleosa]